MCESSCLECMRFGECMQIAWAAQQRRRQWRFWGLLARCTWRVFKG